MNKELGKEYENIEERKSFLLDNCDAAEEVGYMKRFSPDEIIQMKNELSEVSISINDIEEQKKEAMQLFKIQIDPLVTERKELLTNIKTGAEYVKEKCYKFIDYDERMVYFFNADGDQIMQRQILPQEMQKTISLKTGTNN